MMALVACRECGKEVSTSATICPHCGVPTPAVPREVIARRQQSQRSWHRLRQLLGAALLLGVVTCTYAVFTAEPSKPPELANVVNPLLSGHVLPFRLISARIDHIGGDDHVEGQISVAVSGGDRGDWAATATYLARAVLVGGATYTQADVWIDNPWDDQSPTQYKSLAHAYYAPDVARAPWKEPFDVIVAERAPTLADIEWDVKGNELLDRYSNIADPDKRMDRANAEATRYVIAKYHLASTWQTPEVTNPGAIGDPIDGSRINVTAMEGDAREKVDELRRCLESRRRCP